MNIELHKIPILSGVYIIKCLVNKHIYVGSAKDLHSKFEIYERQLKNANHRVEQLNEDIKTYGLDNIELEIVCTCTFKVSMIIERYYIKKYNAIGLGYNTINAPKKLLTERCSITGMTAKARNLLELNKWLERFVLELFDYKDSEVKQVISIADLIDLFEREFRVNISDYDISIIYEILRKLDITTFVKYEKDNVYYEISGNQMWKFLNWDDFCSDIKLDKGFKESLCRLSRLNTQFIECPKYIGKNNINTDGMFQSIDLFKSNNIIVDATYKAQYHKIDFYEYGWGDK